MNFVCINMIEQMTMNTCTVHIVLILYLMNGDDYVIFAL